MDEVLLDIAEVAERCGVAPSALRFYEKRGLISPAGRNGLRRAYLPDVIGRLTLIACARGAGFTIAQIAGFIRATPEDAELRVQMAQKAQELEADIARLSRMRESLHHASTCMYEPLVECPDFKRSFEDLTKSREDPAMSREAPPARQSGNPLTPTPAKRVKV